MKASFTFIALVFAAVAAAALAPQVDHVGDWEDTHGRRQVDHVGDWEDKFGRRQVDHVGDWEEPRP
ncbi:hypothetical protein GGI00_001643 [Coemansia sp. RSA 2681]|nr:hypothetical protein GGI00_001643 [Coemansia sp. RSA 2681]